MECRSVHQVAMRHGNLALSRVLPQLDGYAYRLHYRLPLTRLRASSLLRFTRPCPIAPTTSYRLVSHGKQSIRSLDMHVSPQQILPPSSHPSNKTEKERKRKEKPCKPGITTEQNRTRGADADTGRGKAFLCSLFLSSNGPGYSSYYLLPPTS